MTKSTSMHLAPQSSTLSVSPQERISTPARPSSSFGWTGPRLGGYNGPRDPRPPESEIKEHPSAYRNARHKLLLNTDYKRQFCALDVSDKGGDRCGSMQGLVQGWENALALQERRCVASKKQERSKPEASQRSSASSAVALGALPEMQVRMPESMRVRQTASARPTSALRAPPEVKETQTKGAVLMGLTSEFQHSFSGFHQQPKVENLSDRLFEGWQLALAKTSPDAWLHMKAAQKG